MHWHKSVKFIKYKRLNPIIHKKIYTLGKIWKKTQNKILSLIVLILIPKKSPGPNISLIQSMIKSDPQLPEVSKTSNSTSANFVFRLITTLTHTFAVFKTTSANCKNLIIPSTKRANGSMKKSKCIYKSSTWWPHKRRVLSWN